MLETGSYKFDIPKHTLGAPRSIIKVIGVGGGGSNAVNHMFRQGIKDVEFVVCNTDLQALNNSPVPTKLQIGVDLTEGLGCGANPKVGKGAALESKEQIREFLNGTKWYSSRLEWVEVPERVLLLSLPRSPKAWVSLP
jgi:cell division protein FtsZ